MAIIKKLRELMKTNALPSTETQIYELNAGLRVILGKGDKPLTPAAEIAVWKPTHEDRSPMEGLAVDHDHAALIGAIVLHPTYAKAKWLDRVKILDKVAATYPVFHSPLRYYRQVLVGLAEAQETSNTPLAQRPAARLAMLAKLTSVKEALTDYSVKQWVANAMAAHTLSNAGNPKARFDQIASLAKQKQINMENVGQEYSQYAADMLQADAAFMAADATGKKKRLEQMEKAGQLNFFCSSDLKSFFKVP
jgi:hypothetical protein